MAALASDAVEHIGAEALISDSALMYRKADVEYATPPFPPLLVYVHLPFLSGTRWSACVIPHAHGGAGLSARALSVCTTQYVHTPCLGTHHSSLQARR